MLWGVIYPSWDRVDQKFSSSSFFFLRSLTHVKGLREMWADRKKKRTSVVQIPSHSHDKLLQQLGQTLQGKRRLKQE